MPQTLCSWRWWAVILAVAASGFPAALEAGKFNKVLSVGDTAPAWDQLEGVDGKKHGLDDYRDAALVVQLFTCNHCPVAQGYESRIIALQQQYAKRGLQVVAINVNLGAADSLEKMKQRSAEQKFNFPYLFDPSQQSAARFGASVTPHVFLLDSQRRVVYMGAIDDGMAPNEVKRHYLIDAIEATLAGREPEIRETRQVGCGIEYQQGARP